LHAACHRAILKLVLTDAHGGRAAMVAVACLADLVYST